jgi:hypothetical protein
MALTRERDQVYIAITWERREDALPDSHSDFGILELIFSGPAKNIKRNDWRSGRPRITRMERDRAQGKGRARPVTAPIPRTFDFGVVGWFQASLSICRHPWKTQG